mmetsp:Transcript_71021/g.199241  ORF Transcript_71021/g.199241 Transcript_71021/m.199241 type:complete len:205 (-) Transcript_71021:488-1102(-)
MPTRQIKVTYRLVTILHDLEETCHHLIMFIFVGNGRIRPRVVLSAVTVTTATRRTIAIIWARMLSSTILFPITTLAMAIKVTITMEKRTRRGKTTTRTKTTIIMESSSFSSNNNSPRTKFQKLVMAKRKGKSRTRSNASKSVRILQRIRSRSSKIRVPALTWGQSTFRLWAVGTCPPPTAIRTRTRTIKHWIGHQLAGVMPKRF